MSGADAIFGQDCTTAGSATNPASCTTTGCPSGQTACCRRQNPLWKWNFTQPALAGASYVAGGPVSLGVAGECVGSSIGLYYASINEASTACPTNGFTLTTIFTRPPVSVGSTITLPSSDVTIGTAINGSACGGQWAGTIRIDSDLPNWSVTINATCPSPAASIVGTMSGSQ
jgi:hypothetical protein